MPFDYVIGIQLDVDFSSCRETSYYGWLNSVHELCLPKKWRASGYASFLARGSGNVGHFFTIEGLPVEFKDTSVLQAR